VRIRLKDVPTVTKKLRLKQKQVCALCLCDLEQQEDKNCVLDHDHKTGRIRSVLCRNCNGIEGKVYNLANRAKRRMTVQEWLTRLIKYYEFHSVDRTGLLHPTHKTDEEKKAERLKKARARTATKKAVKTVQDKKGKEKK